VNYQMTLYIADRTINNFMKAADLNPHYKQFVARRIASFSTTSQINEDYFMNIIDKSKDQEDFWIPAIEFCGTLYCDKNIKELSDGKRILFTGV